MSLEEHVWAIEGFSGNEPQTPADVVQLYESLMGAVQRKLLLNKECTEEDLAEIAHAEALSYCAKRWNDPRCRSVVRWVLDPGGLVNVAREGALARTRFWIKRVTSGKFAAWNRSDLIGLLPLSRAVLSRVRSAYTWEAPGSFLGDADLDIVRWTYPLVCGMPAESTVSDEQLAHEWNTSGLPDSGVSVDELRREYSGIEEFALDRRYLWYSEWMSSSGGEYANPDAYDVDFECRAAGLRLVAIAMREAKRFGITDFEDLPDIANETQALEWVERIIARTMALGSELPSDPVSKSIVREPYSTSIPQAGTTSAMSARFTAKLPKSFLCWILDDVTDKSLAPKLLEYGIRLHPEDSLPNRKQTLRLEVDSLVNTPLYHESNRAELLQNWKRRTPK
jgi:hypothetical protein